VYIYNFIIIVYHSNKIFFCLPKNIVDFFVTIFLTYLGLRFYFDNFISFIECFSSSDISTNKFIFSERVRKSKIRIVDDTNKDSLFVTRIKEIDKEEPYLKYVLFFGVLVVFVYYCSDLVATYYYFSNPVFTAPYEDLFDEYSLYNFLDLAKEFSSKVAKILLNENNDIILSTKFLEITLKSEILTDIGVALLEIYSGEMLFDNLSQIGSDIASQIGSDIASQIGSDIDADNPSDDGSDDNAADNAAEAAADNADNADAAADAAADAIADAIAAAAEAAADNPSAAVDDDGSYNQDLENKLNELSQMINADVDEYLENKLNDDQFDDE